MMVHAFVVDGGDHFLRDCGRAALLLTILYSGRFGIARALRKIPISIRRALFDRERLDSACRCRRVRPMWISAATQFIDWPEHGRGFGFVCWSIWRQTGHGGRSRRGLCLARG